MRERGDGGGRVGATDWYGYNTEAMWQLLSNQETSNHWRQVSGWGKINELTRTHLSRLRAYRDSLAAAWPPEKSAAAKAFVDRLDYLIQHVQTVNDVAAANYDAFKTATSTLGTSRHQLRQVHEEYARKKQQKQAYDEELAFATSAQLPGVSLTAPRVTQADLDTLDHQARAIMYDLSGTLAQAQVQIRQPPPYKPPRSERTPGADQSTSGSGGSSGVLIPPVVPIAVSATSALPQTPTASPVGQVPAPTAPGLGPILGGAGPGLAPPSSATVPGVITPSTAPAYPGGPLPGGVVPPFSPRTGLPGPGSLLPAPTTGTPGSAGPGKPGAGGAAGIPRAMPPGGLIGGVPGAGLGQPVAGTAPARRINPIGGMIGGIPAGGVAGGGAAGARPVPLPHPGGPASGTGSWSGGGGGGGSATGRLAMSAGMGPSDGAASGGRSGFWQTDGQKAGQRWDPDNPWETDKGVAPVVQPSTEVHRIDPGPAIGSER